MNTANSNYQKKEKNSIRSKAKALGLNVIPFTHKGRRMWWIRKVSNREFLLNGKSLYTEELRDFLYKKKTEPYL